MREGRTKAFTSFFIAIMLLSSITAYPVKEAHAIDNNYPLSSGEDDGYTFLLVTPGNPPQFTDYFIEDEKEIIMRARNLKCQISPFHGRMKPKTGFSIIGKPVRSSGPSSTRGLSTLHLMKKKALLKLNYTIFQK